LDRGYLSNKVRELKGSKKQVNFPETKFRTSSQGAQRKADDAHVAGGFEVSSAVDLDNPSSAIQ
jgi:hypothetical protein